MNDELKALGVVAAGLGLVGHEVNAPHDEIKAAPIYLNHGLHIETGQGQTPSLTRAVAAFVGSANYVLYVEPALPSIAGSTLALIPGA